MTEEGGEKEGIGAAIGGPLICLAMEGDSLVGGVHGVGKEARVGGVLGVGDTTDVGGGGQHICVAEVICVVWHQAAPLSGGCFWRKKAF